MKVPVILSLLRLVSTATVTPRCELNRAEFDRIVKFAKKCLRLCDILLLRDGGQVDTNTEPSAPPDYPGAPEQGTGRRRAKSFRLSLRNMPNDKYQRIVLVQKDEQLKNMLGKPGANQNATEDEPGTFKKPVGAPYKKKNTGKNQNTGPEISDGGGSIRTATSEERRSDEQGPRVTTTGKQAGKSPKGTSKKRRSSRRRSAPSLGPKGVTAFNGPSWHRAAMKRKEEAKEKKSKKKSAGKGKNEESDVEMNSDSD